MSGSKRALKKKQQKNKVTESMTQSIRTHDNDRTTVHQPVERSMIGACLLTDSESNLRTQTVHRCLMPWLSMGDTW